MHKINEILDRDCNKLKCDSGCPYFSFPHLDVACVLSEVYSVKQGQPCAIYAEKMEQKRLESEDQTIE